MLRISHITELVSEIAVGLLLLMAAPAAAQASPDPATSTATPARTGEQIYSTNTVGPDGTFVPGTAKRCPDGAGARLCILQGPHGFGQGTYTRALLLREAPSGIGHVRDNRTL